MAKKMLQDMTEAELVAKNADLGLQIAQLKAECRAIQDEISDRKDTEAALRAAGNLTPGALKKLAQVVGPDGIASEEAVGLV